MQTPCHITVDPDGYTPLVVDIQRGGVSVSALSRQNGNTHDAVTFPATITGPTVFWLADGVGLAVSMKVDGHEIAADGATPLSVSVPSSGGVAVRPQADALRAAAAGGSGTSSAFAGTTIGTSAMVDDEIIVTYSSVWGINDANEAYYDAAGAVVGEAAVLHIDTTTGAVVVTKPEGANAP